MDHQFSSTRFSAVRLLDGGAGGLRCRPARRAHGAIIITTFLALARPAAAGESGGLPALREGTEGKTVEASANENSMHDPSHPDALEGKGTFCGTVAPAGFAQLVLGPAADCALRFTNPSDEYDPSVARYRIPVVVHVLQGEHGEGYLSEDRIRSQIEILNEDFLALQHSNGEPGECVEIQFHLADKDPRGYPTNGITYTVNETWSHDAGNYYEVLAWDPERYLNVYTARLEDGLLGYVPFFPQEGGVGSPADRVVVHHKTFGRGGAAPYDKGRVLTHEVGHYLGLWHTFQGGCVDPASCHTTGDFICDTNPAPGPNFDCSSEPWSCLSPAPFHNYMDYTVDACKTNFTPEQARRMRCTLMNYRPRLWEIVERQTPDLPPQAPQGLTGIGEVSRIVLDWDDNAEEDLLGYKVYRATQPGGPYKLLAAPVLESTYTDTRLAGIRSHHYKVTAFDAYHNESGFSVETAVKPGGGSGPSDFLRGDGDANGTVNLTDAIFLLNRLFAGGPELPCPKSADTDDSGDINISDAIALLGYLFMGGTPPPFPGPWKCGPDFAPDALACARFDMCP